MASGFKVTIDSKMMTVLIKELEGFEDKGARYVVAGMADKIRDQAINNANAVGLGQSGPAVTPSGRAIVRKGQIPSMIRSYVLADEPRGRVYIQTTPETFHVGWIERGSIHNPPTPFFVRALAEGQAAAVVEGRRRLDDVIRTMNR